MKLLYMGEEVTTFSDFKRLLLLATDLTFTDRPSVTFKNWGTVGADSPMRRVDSSGAPVTISVEAPPSGPAALGYEQYIQADLANPAFRETFLAGFEGDSGFAGRFLQFKANYGGITGDEVRQRIISDRELRMIDDLGQFAPTASLYAVGTPEERRNTLYLLLVHASIAVTSALTVAARIGASPITENSTLARLLSLRVTDKAYIGDRAAISTWLAAAVVNSVVPDEVVQRVSIEDLLKYRERTRESYAEFLKEIDRLSVVLDAADVGSALTSIPDFITAEISPRVKSYRDDLAGARDALFADLLKDVVKWELPTVSLAYLATGTFGAAVTAFLAGVRAAAPAMIDYVKSRREIERKNSFAYLLGVQPATSVVVKP